MLLAREEKSEKKKRFMILEARAFTFNFAVSLSYGKMAYLTKNQEQISPHDKRCNSATHHQAINTVPSVAKI